VCVATQIHLISIFISTKKHSHKPLSIHQPNQQQILQNIFNSTQFHPFLSLCVSQHTNSSYFNLYFHKKTLTQTSINSPTKPTTNTPKYLQFNTISPMHLCVCVPPHKLFFFQSLFPQKTTHTNLYHYTNTTTNQNFNISSFQACLTIPVWCVSNTQIPYFNLHSNKTNHTHTPVGQTDPHGIRAWALAWATNTTNI